MKLNAVFPAKDATRWQDTGLQRFEMELKVEEGTYSDMKLDAGIYSYSLAIEHDQGERRVKIKNERLFFETKPLFEFEEGKAQLYHDDFSQGPGEVPFDWTQSGLAALQARPDNQKLTRFRREVSRFVIARPCPTLMVSESKQDDDTLSPCMENFVSWYRHVSQEHQGALVTLFAELKKVLPGFDSFSLKEVGEDTRSLKVFFQRPGEGRKLLTYDFGELSDGQRMLIALYAIVFGLRDEGLHLFLDEPDNYVALREIQPWLTALADSCGEGVEQAVLISHHPEIINYLAASHGRWFERDENGPARVDDKPRAIVEGLTMAETVARGWDK